MAQLVKNPPAMPETWVRPLSWEDPEGKGRVTCSSCNTAFTRSDDVPCNHPRCSNKRAQTGRVKSFQ